MTTLNKANKMSIAKRNLVFGVGINDADYVVAPVYDGKQSRCPYYSKWTGMLERCYSDKCQLRQSTYIGCSVAKEWHSFMAFREWMVDQDWQGMVLDKDIKVKGNKIYSKETCLFVPSSLNLLLNKNENRKGDLPTGVFECSGKFRASISYDGKRKHLGLFSSIEEASQVYQNAFTLKIKQIITDNIYPMATPYLERHL